MTEANISTAKKNTQGLPGIQQVDEAGSDRIKGGRYLPYSGGLLGWFDNQMVLKTERHNNYKLFTIFEGSDIRQKLFSRWGKELDRRSEERKDGKDIKVSIPLESGTVNATTKDFSHHGVRLQFTGQPDIKKGDSVKMNLLGDGKNITLSIDCLVVWMALSGAGGNNWVVGLGFMPTSPEEAEQIKKVFA